MITFKSKGDFSKATRYFEKLTDDARFKILDDYGKKGVQALFEATPKDSGITANSWGYKVTQENGTAKITFTNSNINKGVPIAIILQYGHGTGTGGWVEGRDYINPAIQPIFDQILRAVWGEVARL